MKAETSNMIVKWLQDHAVYVRTVGIGMLIVDAVILALLILGGNILALFVYLPRIVIAEALLFVPIVYLIKMFKEN